LGQLSRLQQLDLGGNGLTGITPSEVCALGIAFTSGIICM